MADAQKKLQDLSDEFQTLQNELSTIISARQRLDSQLTENKSVATEFSKLKDSNTIYKMVGPVLLKQTKENADLAVKGRLTYIEGEIKRVEAQINETQEKQERKRAEIMGVQAQVQAQGQPAGA